MAVKTPSNRSGAGRRTSRAVRAEAPQNYLRGFHRRPGQLRIKRTIDRGFGWHIQQGIALAADEVVMGFAPDLIQRGSRPGVDNVSQSRVHQCLQRVVNTGAGQRGSGRGDRSGDLVRRTVASLLCESVVYDQPGARYPKATAPQPVAEFINAERLPGRV